MGYGCGPSSTLVALTDRFEVYGDDEDCKDKKGDDKSEGYGDVQANGNVSSFLILHQVMENEQEIYVSVDVAGCYVSNNLNPEDLVESSPIQYHLAPSPQFDNVENFGNVVASD